MVIIKKSELIQKHILSFYRGKNPQRSFYDSVQETRGWDYETNTFYYTPKHALKDLVAVKFYRSDSKMQSFLRSLGLSDTTINNNKGGAYALYRDLLFTVNNSILNIVCVIFKSAMLSAQAKRFPVTAAPCKKKHVTLSI